MGGQGKPALSVEDRQLCVEGLKHGERYAVTLRAGIPSAVRETLSKSAELNIYVRDRKPMVRFTGKAYVQRRLPLGRWRIPALLFVGAYVVMGALLPAAILVWASLLGYVPPSASALQEASLAAYGRLLSDPTFWLAVRNTLVVAGVSALIISLLGGLVGWTLLRLRFPGRTLLDFLSFMSIGIPSVIAGLAIMLLYLTIPIGIYGTFMILIVAYSYRLAVSTRLAKAGLMQLHRELEEASAASGARWMSTQVRIVLPLLRASKGYVVNLASIAGTLPTPGLAAYGAAKAAVIAMTRSLVREEAGAGVRATALCPGFVDTPMAAWTGIPAERMIQPEDCAELVRALLRISPAARVPVLVVEREEAET